MLHWVKALPGAEIDFSVYRPFIRNGWFRKHFMMFVYALMVLLCVLCLMTGGERGIGVLPRLLVTVAVFLVHELLHILVVYSIGEIYMMHSGIFFWLHSDAEMSKGRFWLFMTLPFLGLTVMPAVLLFFVSGPAVPWLKWTAWINAIIASSDIINSVLILLKPRGSFFWRGYYRVGQAGD